MGEYPISGLGRGYPIPGLDGGGGVPHPRSGWCGGVPGVPPLPTRQSSIASTFYAAGGVPLAFTQEDFLVNDNDKVSDAYYVHFGC